MEMLILVDNDDRAIDCREKESCHLIPVPLHRAFSIFIVNTGRQMLIHRRQVTKTTWPGFWTNACCSHPRKGEDLKEATTRRLREELGIACDVKPLFRFRYEADYDEKYGEHEIDHVFLGTYDGDVRQNDDEIQEHKFVPIDELMEDVKNHGEKYTPWFKQSLPGVVKYCKSGTDEAHHFTSKDMGDNVTGNRYPDSFIACPKCNKRVQLIPYGCGWIGVCCAGVLYNSEDLPRRRRTRVSNRDQVALLPRQRDAQDI